MSADIRIAARDGSGAKDSQSFASITDEADAKDSRFVLLIAAVFVGLAAYLKSFFGTETKQTDSAPDQPTPALADALPGQGPKAAGLVDLDQPVAQADQDDGALPNMIPDPAAMAARQAAALTLRKADGPAEASFTLDPPPALPDAQSGKPDLAGLTPAPDATPRAKMAGNLDFSSAVPADVQPAPDADEIADLTTRFAAPSDAMPEQTGPLVSQVFDLAVGDMTQANPPSAGLSADFAQTAEGSIDPMPPVLADTGARETMLTQFGFDPDSTTAPADESLASLPPAETPFASSLLDASI